MDQKLFEELAALDPTPVRKNRRGQDTRRPQYIDWLKVQHDRAEAKGKTLNKPFVRGLLWVHSRLTGIKEVSESLQLKYVNGYTTVEGLYDLIVRVRQSLPPDKPIIALNIFDNYPSDCDPQIGQLFYVPDPNRDRLRRQEVMREITKGKQGRFAHFMEPNTQGVIPLEVVHNHPGVMTVARCNTHEAQQAISGDQRTPWCIALNGEKGEEFFSDYAIHGGLYTGQFTLMFDISGRMYAVTGRSKLNGRPSISIEDYENHSISFQALVAQEIGSDPKVTEAIPHAALAMIASCNGQTTENSFDTTSYRISRTRLITARDIAYGTLSAIGNSAAEVMSKDVSEILENGIHELMLHRDSLDDYLDLFGKCPALFEHQTADFFIDIIKYEIADGNPLAVAKTLKHMQENSVLFAEIMRTLPDKITFPPVEEGHEPGYLLQVFGDFPELHPKIHELGLGCNIFADLLPELPKDQVGFHPVVEVELTKNGFKTYADKYEGFVMRVVSMWTHIHAPNRERHLQYEIPCIVNLMKRGAEATTVPALREAAERDIESLRIFLKPRGIVI